MAIVETFAAVEWGVVSSCSHLGRRRATQILPYGRHAQLPYDSKKITAELLDVLTLRVRWLRAAASGNGSKRGGSTTTSIPFGSSNAASKSPAALCPTSCAVSRCEIRTRLAATSPALADRARSSNSVTVAPTGCTEPRSKFQRDDGFSGGTGLRPNDVATMSQCLPNRLSVGYGVVLRNYSIWRGLPRVA